MPITCVSAQPEFEIGPNWVSLGPAPIVPSAAVSYSAVLSPPVSGRATILAVNPQNRYNVWLGTAGGGLWVTNNANVGGLGEAAVKVDSGDFDRNWQPQWFPLSDGLASLSIGAIVLDPSSCTAAGCLVAYIGTGENSLRRDTYWGDGVYRVAFGGSVEFPTWSWTRLDTDEQFRFGNTAALVLDGAEVLVALSAGNTTTSLYASVRAPEPAAGYGVHRRDASGNWTRIFQTTSHGNERWADQLLPTDLVKLPSGAASFLLGIHNDGLFLTTDRGVTWCALNPGSALRIASQNGTIATAISDCSAGSGLPSAGSFDHVELAVHPSGAVHAVLGNCPSGYTAATQGATSLCQDTSGNNRSPWIFKSSGGASSWTAMGQIPFAPSVQDEGHYSRYTHALSAVGENTLVWGGLAPWVIDTSGSTLAANKFRSNSLHYDVHDLRAWGGWDQGEGVAYAATDGGFYFYPAGVGLWTAGNDSLITTAFVSIALDYEDEDDDSYPRTTAILGGLQDNSNAVFNGSPKWQLWGPIGDGGEALIQTPTITFDSIHDNNIRRVPGYGGNFSSRVNGLRVNAEEDIPFYSALTQHEASKRVFVGTDVVSVRDGAPDAWDSSGGAGVPSAVQISPVFGADGNDFPPIETDRDLITALAVAPSHGWRVYVGLYSGALWHSNTSASTQPSPNFADWNQADAGLPAGTISSIAVDPSNPDRLWVAFSAFIPQSIWYSTDAGASWQARSNGLPAKEPVKVIKAVPDEPNKLWAGTDLGVYVSEDGGSNWSPRMANLPRSPVFDLEVDHYNNRVFAATHGRGVWMFSEEGPQLTVFEGWMEDGIWDVPIYGIGFDCAEAGGCDCTVDIEREDSSVCASGTLDAIGNRIFIPQGEHTLRTENQGSCTRCDGKPVVFGCFNGDCVGGAKLASCNQDGHRVAAVKVRCEGNPTATGSIAGFCPEQHSPPSNLFEVTTGLNLPGTTSPGGPVPVAPASAPLALLAVPTVLSSPANGGDRALCSALFEFDASAAEATQLGLRDAINASHSCQAAGVTASVVQESPLQGEDSPGLSDLRVTIAAPAVEGAQLVLGVAAQPGDAIGLCYNMDRLGVYLANQVAITQIRFPTAPGGAAGGELLITENSPVGSCTMRVPTSLGQTGAEIAAAVVQAFATPGVPQPRTCPESNNPRDFVLDGDSVVSIMPTSLRACVFDNGVGFSFGPHGVPIAPPVPVVQHAAQVLCGVSNDPDDMRVAQGFYATTVNVRNPTWTPVFLRKSLALTYPPEEQNPGKLLRIGTDLLSAREALKTDCIDIQRRLFPSGFPTPYVEGFVVVESSQALDVVGVYSTAALGEDGRAGPHTSIHLERAPATRLVYERPKEPPEPSPKEPDQARICYDLEASGGEEHGFTVETQFELHKGMQVGPARWLCEAAFKAHEWADLPKQAPSELPLLCHEVRDRPIAARVELADRNGFFTGEARVDDPLMMCNPALRLSDADGAARLGPIATSTRIGYRLEASALDPPAHVLSRDHHGTLELRFKETALLLDPATVVDAKGRMGATETASGGDSGLADTLPGHCYRVDGPTIGSKFVVEDATGRYQIQVLEPCLFCDPTRKSHLGTGNRNPR
ncbi:MAG: hypothetical protein WBG92_18660 [Thiohalocapsa sp.]